MFRGCLWVVEVFVCDLCISKVLVVCCRNRSLGKGREGPADILDSLFPTLSGALRIPNHNRFAFSRASRSVAVLAVSHRSCNLGASFCLMVAAASSKEKPLLTGC